MKKLAAVFLLLHILTSVYSQDLIVRDDGDSINCEITEIKDDNIYFKYLNNGDFKSTLIPVSRVKTYQYNYFINTDSKEKYLVKRRYKHFRFAVNGGYSYRTASISDNISSVLAEYLEGLKSGAHYGGDLTYYFKGTYGIGAMYYMFKTSNKIDNVYYIDNDGNTLYGELSDDISISYIGPTINARIFSRNDMNAFFLGFSVGYMEYYDNMVVIDNYKMTGNTVGFVFDFGFDLGLSENMFLGIQLSLISGVLTGYDWDDGSTVQTIVLDSNEYESLSRIDFSIGLRFSK